MLVGAISVLSLCLTLGRWYLPEKMCILIYHLVFVAATQGTPLDHLALLARHIIMSPTGL